MKKNILDRIYARESTRWICAILMGLILFLVFGAASSRIFFINDDENIMYTLAGYYTNGEPFDHPFINYILAGFLRLLYGLVPTIPWYGVFHIIVLYSSVVVIINVILKEGYYAKLPFSLSIIIVAALFVSTYLYPTMLIQFTTTSAMAGVAAVALILSIDFKNDLKRTRFLYYFISLLLLLICYMHRKNTGYVICCFYFGTLVYQIIKYCFGQKKSMQKNGLKELVIHTLIVLCALVSVIGISSIKRSTSGWDYYYNYDNARFKITDYPHDTIQQNPDLYESIGWNDELYELAGGPWLFFMDPNINADSFTKIAQTGYYRHDNRSIAQVVSVVKQLFENDIIAVILLVVACICSFSVFILFVKDKDKKVHIWEYLYSLCILLGTLLLIVYLCYKQRLPLRAFHTIILPYILIMALMSIRMVKICKIYFTKAQKNLVGLIIILSAILACRSIVGVITDQVSSRLEKSNRTLIAEAYAIEHPQFFYIYDSSLTFRYLPFTVYNDAYPSNLTYWGGMGWNSPAFYKQLEVNNLGSLYTDALLRQEVYYITWDDYVVNGRTMRERLLAYMCTLYPSVQVDLVDSLGQNINVYKFNYYK